MTQNDIKIDMYVLNSDHAFEFNFAHGKGNIRRQLIPQNGVVIVTALFLHHLAVICCILHITACVALTPS